MTLSDVMRSILAIPDGKAHDDPMREGTVDYPLYLPGTNTQEFNDFLLWMYRNAWEPLGGSDSERERICTNLLKLSHLWEIEGAKAHAVAALEQMNLAPSHRLALARQFTISAWVKPAVTEILDSKLRNLTDSDVLSIGWKEYSILAKAKEILEEETRRTAFVPPPMDKDPSWECKTHSSCLLVWPKLWFDRIGRELLHANTPLKLKHIYGKCAKIKFADEGVITGCAEAIIKYHNSL
ncbi:hypothetical protein C8R45DRAFT_1078494 [Mycena sanguinolenta]|nr:hypothetical protein C8R45DRAFT_1078494 [Mycena sanguinolenta]